MQKSTDENLIRLNDYVRRISGCIADLDPDALTEAERTELYDVFITMKSVAAAGRAMMETALA